MATIRLNISKDLAKILRELKEKRFVLLDNAEIVRAVLSEYYALLKSSNLEWNEKEFLCKLHALPELELTDKEQCELTESMDAAEREGGEITTREELWKDVESS